MQAFTSKVKPKDWRHQLAVRIRCWPMAHEGWRAFALSFRIAIECSPLSNEKSFHERFLSSRFFMHRFGARV